MKQKSFLEKFGDIDNSEKFDSYRLCLDAISQDEQTKIEREKVLNLLHLEFGNKILDIGCGSGDEYNLVEKFIGSNGKIIGIDKSVKVIEYAKSKEFNDIAKFEVMNAEKMSFADNTFDATKSERCFSHIEKPKKALQEIKRVTKSNGKILIHDNDWETFIINSNYPKISYEVKNIYKNYVKNGNMGRKLYGLFKDVGFKDIKIDFTPFHYTDLQIFKRTFHLESILKDGVEKEIIKSSKVDAWLNDLKIMDKNGQFIAFGMGIIVSAINE